MEQELVTLYSPNAEQAILYCILTDNNLINTVNEKLSPQDFFDVKNRYIFQCMRSLSDTNRNIDYISITEELKRMNLQDTVTMEDIANIQLDTGVYVSNISYYIDTVLEYSTKRKVLDYANSLISKVNSSENDAAGILEYCEQNLFKLSQRYYKGGLTKISEFSDELLDKLMTLNTNKNSITGLTTGYRALDSTLSGLQPSDLVLIAARPSMGKTALGINIAYNAAKSGKQGERKKVAIFSLEMSNIQLLQRLLSISSSTNLADLLRGSISDWSTIYEAMGALSDLDIYIDDTSSISISELRSKCRRMKLEKGLDLVVIDYLQLMTVDDKKSENRQQEISTISRGLKALAKEMNCPVIALSQLSRKAETHKYPMMSDLRESGAIEQDADVVMLLYREDYYDKETKNVGVTDVIIAKHRNGAVGTEQLFFKKEYTLFSDIKYENE